MTLANLLLAIADIVTACVSWIGSFVGCVTANPLLLIFILIPLVGLGIGLFRRLLSL